jgi:2-dehydropantoate 2-reductase
MTVSPAQNSEAASFPERVCVFGAGAIGGALAVRLATAPALSRSRVSVVARGAHLAAIRKDGLRLWSGDASVPIVAEVAASDDPSDLGPQDLVVTTLKGHQLPAAARAIAALLKPETRVIMIQNGIPFWYFHGAPRLEGRRLAALDPSDALWDLIGPSRVIGGVVYQPAEIIAPGEIRDRGAGLLYLGEPDGGESANFKAAAATLGASGWRIVETTRIRDEIWRKLVGNAAFNPVSALTRATVTAMAEDPPVADLIRRVMNDVIAVGEAVGAKIEMTADERIAQARGLGPVRSSMLQDVLAGRRMEIAPLIGAVVEIGAMTNVPTPALDAIHALIDLLDRSDHRNGA